MIREARVEAVSPVVRPLLAALILAFASGCGDGYEPSLEGPPFFSASIDGGPWEPGTGASDLVAVLQPGRAFIVANRFLVDEQVGEFVQLEFDTPDPFRITRYLFVGGTTGHAILRIHRGSNPDALYQTNPGHGGSVAIRAADPSDSVVTGTFVFEAGQLGGSGVRQVSGSFRVRFVTSFP